MSTVGLSPNELLLGRYRLVRELGRGLGGVTWLATDEQTDEGVALKVVREADAGDPEAFSALLSEAGKLRSMPEEHVVGYLGVHDFKREGWAALLTEYLPGGDLDQHLREHGPYGEKDAARLGLQVGRAVLAVHERGIMHRDLKPANVLVEEVEGALPVLRVADFGISRKLRQGRLEGTRPVGTRGYAAPEQFKRGPLTWAVDVYALGGVLQFLATGQDPDDSLGGRLGEIAAACRTVDPAQRPMLGEVIECLAALVEGREPAAASGEATADWGALVEPTAGSTGTAASGQTAGSGETAVPEPTAEELVEEVLADRRVRRRRVGVAMTLLILLTLAAVKRLAFPNEDPTPEVAVEPADEPVQPVVEKPEQGSQPEVVEPVETTAPVVKPPPEPVYGTLILHSHPWSTITVNGEAHGRTGGKPVRLEVEAGEVRLEFVAEDGRKHAKTLQVRPGESTHYCWNHDVEEAC